MEPAAVSTTPGFLTRPDTDHDRGPASGDVVNVDLCEEAHGRGLRVILDIIANHTGDNWGYLPPGEAPSAARNEPPFLPWPANQAAPFSRIAGTQ